MKVKMDVEIICEIKDIEAILTKIQNIEEILSAWFDYASQYI